MSAMRIIGLVILMLILGACSSVERSEVPLKSNEGIVSEQSEQMNTLPAGSSADAMSVSPPPRVRADLDDFGLAPELTNQVWINVDRPYRLQDLHGKVVLLDIWTFG